MHDIKEKIKTGRTDDIAKSRSSSCILKLLGTNPRLIVEGVTDASGLGLGAAVHGQVILLFLWLWVLGCLLGH